MYNLLRTYRNDSLLLKCTSGYRYGYNTQEKVDEIAGAENHYTAKFWEYDLRAVHRWNTDPKPHPSYSPYAINQGNPIWFSDPLGDTVRVEGFSEKKITKDLGKGMGVKKDANPFSFDDGKLQMNQEQYDALSDEQKSIAGNINETINSDITFTITKGKSSQVLGTDAKGNNITLWDVGGAATVGNPNDPKNVRIWMDGTSLTGTDRPTDKNGTYLKTPTWLSLYHELGGHGHHRYVMKDQNQAGKTIDYENIIRGLHNLGVRDYDDQHPKPKN